MKVILKHPCGVSTYEEFSAIPRKGDSFEYNEEYFERIMKIVRDKYNLKKSYQLYDILFRWASLTITYIKWVYDEETGSYIAEIELMKACNDEKEYGCYPTYLELRKFVDRRKKTTFKKSKQEIKH